VKNQSLGWWVLLGVAASACGGEMAQPQAARAQDVLEVGRVTALDDNGEEQPPTDETPTDEDGEEPGGGGDLPWWGDGPPPWAGGGGDGDWPSPNPPNPPANPCVQVDLDEYNLFVQGNYTQGHDVQGKVAAGGDVSMTYFSVGGSLAQDNTSNVLVAGGNLFLNSGSVYGNGSYGGYTTAGQNVTVHRGTLSQGTPIDFTARFAELESLSTKLGSAPNPTGTTRIESWGGLYFEGHNAGVNTFSVDASQFGRTVYMNINAPAGSRVIINVRGASARFANFGSSFSGGIDQKGVLFNFIDATKIEASSYGFWGTILAPKADVTFNNGSWDGGIYARSLTGTAEGHVNPLQDFEYCTLVSGD
jgi:choice-of-anchor A domain-containing protein